LATKGADDAGSDKAKVIPVKVSPAEANSANPPAEKDGSIKEVVKVIKEDNDASRAAEADDKKKAAE
jgi:hypothetical protein